LACGGSNAGTLKVQSDSGTPGSGSSGSSGTPGGGDDEGGSGATSGASSAGDSSGAGSGATSGSMSEGGAGSGTSSGSGNPAPIPVPDGGAPSDPGSVVCNHAECSVSTSVCCQSTGNDGGASETCQDFKVQCSGTSQACNEASDCPTGSVCCFNVVGIGVPGNTVCSAVGKGCAVSTTTFQTCRTDAECGKDADGGTIRCLPQVCTDLYNPANTIELEACEVPGYSGAAPQFPHNGYLAYCGPPK
jgi:hypothetical protein